LICDLVCDKKSIGIKNKLSLIPTLAMFSTIRMHLQASSAYNGVGIVKLMGRQSGFITMYATIASGQVDIVLIPEVQRTIL